jgi:RNA polymerase sigma factor (TIGR02999 family)
MPSPDETNDVTGLLVRMRRGDQAALDELMPRVYAELRRIAGAIMKGERPDHTLQPTAVVHEAYVQLLGLDEIEWQSRAHFLAMSARCMRRILVDHARARGAAKRGGDVQKVTLDDRVAAAGPDVDLLVLHRALERLAGVDERAAAVIELRFFGGLTTDETAEVLGISCATADRDRANAVEWLRRELVGLPPSGDR